MRKGETGQAFILVLILLAIGALLIVPALRLTGTSLKSSQILARHVRAMYAADGAQEYVLWKLAYDPDYAASFTVDGQSDNFTEVICGKEVDVNVVMRAVPGQGGMTLATEHVIKPTKTVEHQYLPDPVPDKRSVMYTYTINLEQLSENTTQGLDAIYDLPPGAINDYIEGSSQLSVDGGSWMDIPDPDTSQLVSKGYIKWPADYDPDTGEGAFSSNQSDVDRYFYGIRDFEVRQEKEIRFQMEGSLDNNDTHCNWVVLKPWNTLSGPQAPIDVGLPDNPGECHDDSVLEVSKVSDPEVIQPGVEEDIEYTISITNLYTQTRFINEITDYLPPGFYYTDNTSSPPSPNPSGITTIEPQRSLENINGVNREVLLWTTAEFPKGNAVGISADETLMLTFWARTTKDVSGSYYNEVIVILAGSSLPPGFGDIGLLPSEYGSNYSWNTGAVIVPAYDSRTDADDVYIDANMALTLDSISITSWQIY